MAHRFRSFQLPAGQMRTLLNALTASAADRPRWMTILLWGMIPVMLLVPVGLSFWAVTDLFGLPALPQCLTVSWSDENFAARLYCAKITADRRTPPDFQAAIEMVSRIPRSEPLRVESDRLIRQWSEDLLRLGDAKFQAGDLEEAIEIAEKIPQTVQTRRLADDRIQQWQDSWDKATLLYEDAQQKLNDKDWPGAMTAARQLLTLGNQYWATTQHAELMRQFQTAKDNDQKEKTASADRDRSQKPANSPAQDFLSKIQQEQATDARTRITNAKDLAAAGTIDGLQAAISEAQQVIFGTEGYEEAQAAIDNWRQQIELIEDRPILNRALGLAEKGDEASLQAAISEANQIQWGRDLYDEANGYVEQWRDRVFQLQSEARTRQLEAMDRRAAPSPPVQPASLSHPPVAPAEPLRGDRSTMPSSAVSNPSSPAPTAPLPSRP
jgi:hypothetical protein